MKIPSGLRFTLTVDGKAHVVDVDAISARHVGELEMFFSITPERVVTRLVGQEVTPLEAAAAVYLAERQAGRTPDPDELLDSITLGSSCEVTFEGEVLPSLGRDADPNS